MCCMGETSQYQNAGTHLKWYLCGFATVKRIILSKKVFTVDKNFRHIPFSKHFRHVQLSYSKIREGVELGGREMCCVDKFPNDKPVMVETPYTTYHEMCPNIDACTHKMWENITKKKKKIPVTTLPINAELTIPLHFKVLK